MVSRRPLSSPLTIAAPTASRNNVVKSRIAVASLVRRRLQMLPQEITPEVTVEVAPDRVHVIAVVLAVVEFDRERRALHAVVMLLPALSRSRPRTPNLLDPGRLHLGHAIGGDVGRHQSRIGIED